MYTEANFELIGRLTKHVEIPEQENHPVILPLAINRSFKREDGSAVEQTQFFDVVTWNKGARTLTERGAFTKGRYLLARGELEDQRWESDEGKRKRIVLKASEVRFLDPKPD